MSIIFYRPLTRENIVFATNQVVSGNIKNNRKNINIFVIFLTTLTFFSGRKKQKYEIAQINSTTNIFIILNHVLFASEIYAIGTILLIIRDRNGAKIKVAIRLFNKALNFSLLLMAILFFDYIYNILS